MNIFLQICDGNYSATVNIIENEHLLRALKYTFCSVCPLILKNGKINSIMR